MYTFRVKNKLEVVAAYNEKKRKDAERKNKQKAKLSKMAYQQMIQINEVLILS